MPNLVRLSLSIEKPLYDRLETLVEEKGYTNRSEFVRDLIRDRLVEREWDRDEEILGTITVLFEHQITKTNEKMLEEQHSLRHNIIVSTHIHLTADLCAEVIVCKGKAKAIKELTDNIRRQKGVLHATLAFSSLGKKLA